MSFSTKIARLAAFAGVVWLGASPLAAQLRPETGAQRQPAKPTRVVVETAPGAEVYLDDVFQGRASAAGRVVIANAKAGEHTLRVTLAGKKDFESSISVAAGKDVTAEVALAELPARIVVHSAPGADVFLNDARRGATDANGELVLADLATGSYALRVSTRGKKDFQEQVEAAAGKDVRVQATLLDQPGRIVVHSIPGAEVALDDSRRGSADANGELIVADVPPGAHVLRVSARGKKDLQEQVEIAAGEKAIVQAALSDAVGTISLHSAPGADVLLDDVRRGTTDSAGNLVLQGIAPGPHDLRVWATGKKNYQQLVSLSAGQDARVEAVLAPVDPPPSAVHAAPAVETLRVSAKMGPLMYIGGTLTVASGKISYRSDSGKFFYEFEIAQVDRAYETLGDLGSRHDLHVVMKSGQRYEMINHAGAGHGTAGAQFVSHMISVINGGLHAQAR